jgi:hypothetical protein
VGALKERFQALLKRKVRTSDKKSARIKLLEENYTLATEAASKEDEHGAGGDGITELSGARLEGGFSLDGYIVSGVEARAVLVGAALGIGTEVTGEAETKLGCFSNLGHTWQAYRLVN